MISWLAIDNRAPSALYFASDSRITWGSNDRRWDVGRKLFACKRSPDIFGYAGEVIFPSLVLGQMVEAVDHELLIGLEAPPDVRHAKYVQTIRSSFEQRQNAPDYDFQILHGARMAADERAAFQVWQISYAAHGRLWSDEELHLPHDRSDLIVALGSGAPFVRAEHRRLLESAQGGTSRATFWALCDSLRSNSDPLSGGPPQLVGIYKSHGPRAFGLLYNGQRYFHGLPVDTAAQFDAVEWRDEHFQRIDGTTLQLVEGAQRHGR